MRRFASIGLSTMLKPPIVTSPSVGGMNPVIMRMVTGFMPPSSGRVTIGGHDVAEEPIAAKRLIGYLPENAAAYPDMTVHGFLNFAAELRGMTTAERKAAVDRVVEMCFLQGVLHQSVETLSKGYRHRTCFAQSIIHDPQVLILDEPTDGLDPNQKHEVRTLIRRMGETKAIIFSTHILEEVEAVCSRAIIIDRGTIVANGTPAELKQEIGGDVIVMETKDPERLAGRIRTQFGVDTQVLETQVRIEKEHGHRFVMDLVQSFPGEIDSVSIAKPSLEDVFIRRTGHRFWTEEAKESFERKDTKR